MATAWFETVAVAQRRARQGLPKPVYDALLAGSERGTTMSDNVAAFAELGWLPVRRRPAGGARDGDPGDRAAASRCRW